MQYVKQSTETYVIVGPALDVSDGFTPETGLTLAAADEAEIIKHNTTSVTDISGATMASVTNCDGYYALTLTSSLTDTCGRLTVVIQDDSVCLPIRADFMVVNANVFDSLFAAATTDYLQTDAVQWLGTACATPTVAGVPEVDVTHITGAAVSTTTAQLGVNIVQISEDATAANNLEAACDGTTYNIGGGAVVAASVTGTVGSVTGAVGSVTGAVGSVGVGGITATSIADSAIDLATFAADCKTGSALKANVETITAGAITAAAIATGAIDADAIADNAIDAGAIASNAITDAKINTGAITAAKFAAGAIDATAIANGAIDNATFAADVGSTAYASNIIALAVRKVLDELNLDHLLKVAVANNADMTTEIVDSTILSNIMTATGDTSDYAYATDSLETLGTTAAAILADTGTDGVVLAADAITSAKIADNAIAAEHLAANAIDLATFAADCKTGSALKANVETITAGAITATAIATGAIDADALSADAGTEIAAAVAGHATLVSILADTAELQAEWVDGGRLDLILDARASQSSVDTVDNFLDTEIAAITAAVITNAAGVDIAADIIALKAETAAILADTGTDGVVLAADAITSAKIADNAIAAEHLAANAIDLATFAADCKTGSALKANVETITSDAITAAALKTDAVTEIVTAILAGTVEGSYTVVQSLRAILALFGGEITGLTAGVGDATIRDISDSKTRAVSTVTSDGNRTAVASIDLS